MATSITPGQTKQIVRFGSDAVELAFTEAGLDNSGAQRVIEHGDDFSSAIRAAALASLRDLSVSDRFKDEEVPSQYGYPAGYKKPKPIDDQLAMLAKLFSISFGGHVLDLALPECAEGWFAVPRWEKVAPTYNAAVEFVLWKIAETRTFRNYRAGGLGPDRLRMHERTARLFAKLGETQKGDILLVPAQFGIRHRGRSVRRAREVFSQNEFGLGAFAVGVMLLTHPERLVDYEDLWIDCAGDEYAPSAGGDFSYAPYFYWYGGQLKFVALWLDNAYEHYGSSSGFLPKSLLKNHEASLADAF